MDMTYRPRIADIILKQKLDAMGAVQGKRNANNLSINDLRLRTFLFG